MTLADRLRAQGEELIRLANEIDSAAPLPAPGRDQHFLDTNKAMAISHKSSSWLYANGRRFGFGWRLQSGAWAFSESQLRAFLAGGTACEKSELCEKSDAPPLSISPKSWHDSDS